MSAHAGTAPGLTDRPTVGVAIVNYNGGERVLRVLAALKRQRHPIHEVIVVDNASTDSSPERIREEYPDARLVQLVTNSGPSFARNVGFRELSTTLVLLLDHDVYVEEDCVERMVRAYEAHRPTVVCPRIRLIPELDVVQADGAALHYLGTLILRNAFTHVNSSPAVAGPVQGCISACLLLDRRKVIEAGGFDELFFFYFEDLEFSMRLRAMGHRFWLEPEALVYHERAAGTPNLSFRGQGQYPPRRAYLTMRNRVLSILIHYRLRTLLMLLPALILYEVATFVAACWKGWPRLWFRAWAWQLENRSAILDRRRRMQRLRSVDDRELLVGGPPPIAIAFLTSPFERRMYAGLARFFTGYWNLARGWIG